MSRYLAVDLGAESGRVMLGTLEGGRISLEEIHRFPNKTLTRDGHLHWDLAHLEKEIFAGVEKAAGRDVAGLSTDSWGVDYVLLDEKGEPVAPPFCYRDARHHESPGRLHKKISFEEIYRESGIQFMSINTLYQLEAERHAATPALAKGKSFLTIADYFNSRFCAVDAIEESLASTTQIYNPKTRQWSQRLIAELGLEPSLFPKIVPSGTVLGGVTEKWRPVLGDAKVVATCSHDTGAAIAAIPAKKGNWAYLSSGTWSLLGAELPAPVVTDAAREAGFTNEVGINGTIRFLKNITGLWVLQECRRAWEAAGEKLSYDELTRLATEAAPARAHLSLRDARFSLPGDMPEKIAAYCRETGQPAPASPGETARLILESLALTYADVLRQLEGLMGHKVETLHIVGGGSRNRLLNQLTADAIGIRVVAGPVEATAIGNVLIQALALGHLESVEHIRRLVEASFPTETVEPGSGLITDATRARFAKLK